MFEHRFGYSSRVVQLKKVKFRVNQFGGRTLDEYVLRIRFIGHSFMPRSSNRVMQADLRRIASLTFVIDT